MRRAWELVCEEPKLQAGRFEVAEVRLRRAGHDGDAVRAAPHLAARLMAAGADMFDEIAVDGMLGAPSCVRSRSAIPDAMAGRRGGWVAEK